MCAVVSAFDVLVYCYGSNSVGRVHVCGGGGVAVTCACCRCTWMYGELTEKEAVERVDRALDHHLADQFEILLYKKNRTYPSVVSQR